MGLIIPGSNDNLSKMAKEAGAPPPQMQAQIPLDHFVAEISAQVANQMFVVMMTPVIERIDAIEKKLGIENGLPDENEAEDDTNVQC